MRAIFLVGLLTAAAAAAAGTTTSGEDRAIFRSAGLTYNKGSWRSDCGDPGTPSYRGGAIERIGDINGDGLADVLVTEESSYCYGQTGTAFWLLAGQAGGKWKLMHKSVGIAVTLKTRGIGRWPDLAIGGPGFCFAVLRWNGQAYAHNRYEYEGKRCRQSL